MQQWERRETEFLIYHHRLRVVGPSVRYRLGSDEISNHHRTGEPRSIAEMRDDAFGESVNRFSVDGAR
ncbi:MAG: hypothetical protein ACXWWP_07495, partial [Candidatus Binatia bacterium]